MRKTRQPDAPQVLVWWWRCWAFGELARCLRLSPDIVLVCGISAGKQGQDGPRNFHVFFVKKK